MTARLTWPTGNAPRSSPGIAAAEGGVEGAADDSDPADRARRLVVPSDGSASSLRAVDVAAAVAAKRGLDLDVVVVVDDPAHAAVTDQVSAALARRRGPARNARVTATGTTPNETGGVGAVLDRYFADQPGSLVVMSTRGRGRSQPLLGGVTTALLSRSRAPVMLVGPGAVADRIVAGGDVVIAYDGSDASSELLEIGARWACLLGATPRLTSVVQPTDDAGAAWLDRRRVHAAATRLAERTGREVADEVLHDERPAHALAEHAAAIGASAVVAGTHARTGLARAAFGSVAMDIVRHAPCPVILHRPHRN